jgi:ferritin-like metal-binding protein YciE
MAASQELRDQVAKHIDEAIAMEQNVLRMLDSIVASVEDDDLKEAFRLHKVETEEHNDRLMRRLEDYEQSPSVLREATGIAGALMKGVIDVVRSERSARAARDAYATEHVEIAAYQLLERVAQRAGDEETAEVARQNRADEESMARTIDAHWDRFAELALEEAGVTA